MVLLQVDRLTKSVGDRMLFSDVTFGVNEGNKIGLIARNGTGKSTMLRIIAGIEAADSGTVTFNSNATVGILEQIPKFQGNPTVLEACLSGETPTARIVRQYEKALAYNNREQTAALIPEMDALNAWDYEDRARQLLTQLDITEFDRRVSTLSGGQLKRIALCRVLIDNPSLLILDEPTNHLDIHTIEWLEGWLSRQRVTLLLVTHDRYFLDRVCNNIIEIDRNQIFNYDGNYDYYLRRRQERIEAMTAELAKVKNTLRRELEWMRRQPQARAGKAKYRIDAFHDLQARSRVNLTEKNIEIKGNAGYIGSKIFEAKGVSKRFGNKVILEDFNYTFGRYEKLGIIGENGVGKTTFIKMLQGIEKTDTGSWEIGETVRFGYYSQTGISLDPNKKVIDAITEVAEEVSTADGRKFTPMQFLQHFLFTPADQQKYIGTLSGGEKARLHLAEVLMRAPNFLILDEPTNDLDIVTLGILEDYLRDFAGCLIIVSHDRFFLDSTVDHLFVFQGNGQIKDFPGTYSEYRLWDAERKKSLSEPQVAEAFSAKTKTERKPKLTFKEKQELKEISERIEQLSKEKINLEAIFSGNVEGNIDEASTKYSYLCAELDELELRWLELSEKE